MRNDKGGFLKVWSWAFICVALTFIVYIEYREDPAPAAVSSFSPVQPAIPAMEPRTTDFASLPDLGDLTEVVERPLFAQNRRPAPPGASVDAPAPKTGQQFAYGLSGIVISSGQQMALLSHMRTKEIRQIRLGETVDGWKVTEISADQVILKRNEEIQSLRLIDQPQPARRPTPNTRAPARNLPGQKIAPDRLFRPTAP
ncbi:MAG: hypothetical protein OEY85_03270 [Rhodospirillales bacterium]|nr:hypothetical protein [Rhodospirillales bacterium]